MVATGGGSAASEEGANNAAGTATLLLAVAGALALLGVVSGDPLVLLGLGPEVDQLHTTAIVVADRRNALRALLDVNDRSRADRGATRGGDPGSRGGTGAALADLFAARATTLRGHPFRCRGGGDAGGGLDRGRGGGSGGLDALLRTSLLQEGVLLREGVEPEFLSVETDAEGLLALGALAPLELRAVGKVGALLVERLEGDYLTAVDTNAEAFGLGADVVGKDSGGQGDGQGQDADVHDRTVLRDWLDCGRVPSSYNIIH